MKIKVIYPHGIGYVEPAELEKLIVNGEIMAFERSNKLVFLGVHPVRKRVVGFDHPDRRRGTEH